ncbi:MAG: sugar phosphate isomerase/epimerase, partial [Acidobacteria bacterium]|nr:sugar phosphate isomerase/epimerase [Acidobacteriota bacterium]
MDRRSFLLASLAGAASAKARYAPKIAVQVYIWTQEFATRKISLAEGLPELFRSCHQAGYRRISLLNGFFTPELFPKTQQLVKEYGFEVPDTYTGGRLNEEAAALRLIETACRQADKASKPKHGRKSDEELNLQARMMNRLGEALKRRGVSLLVHQHSPEMAENAREWRWVLRNTDPKLVSFNLDLDWVLRGGGSPLELLEEAGARLASTHIRSSRKGVWSESVGEGDIDYAAVAAWMRKHEFSGYLTAELAYEDETKVTRPLEENLRL